MRFNNIFEEEYYFPCEGLTLDEGREFRYLMNNTFDFLEGDIIQMQLIKNGEVINANGMYGSNSGNKTFVGKIIKSKDGYVIRNTISNPNGVIRLSTVIHIDSDSSSKERLPFFIYCSAYVTKLSKLGIFTCFIVLLLSFSVTFAVPPPAANCTLDTFPSSIFSINSE